jgi:hypothetical protein
MVAGRPFLSFLAGLLMAVVSSTVVPATALAQGFACSLETVESVACIAGRLCTCSFARGSPATGLPDGFRWDCGILRPACGQPLPATIDAYRGPLPESLAIERSATNVITITGGRKHAHGDQDGKPERER